MTTTPLDTYDCNVMVPGWRLHIAQMMLSEGRDLGNVIDLAVQGAEKELRRRFPDGRLEGDELLASVRVGLKDLGLDPGSRPPCSELLLSSFLEDPVSMKGCLPWEFLAILTVKSMAPWSVLDRASLVPPLEFRVGGRGETLFSGSGTLDCEGLPVLADSRGIQASPWTHRSPEDPGDCRDPLFVCYLPKALFRTIQPKSHMGRVVWLTWAYRFVFERTCDFKKSGD